MFYLGLKNRPLHVGIAYYFVSTSPNLSWICNTYTDICIPSQFHSSVVRYGDTHELKKSPKTRNTLFEIGHEQMLIWFIAYSDDKYHKP